MKFNVMEFVFSHKLLNDMLEKIRSIVHKLQYKEVIFFPYKFIFLEWKYINISAYVYIFLRHFAKLDMINKKSYLICNI